MLLKGRECTCVFCKTGQQRKRLGLEICTEFAIGFGDPGKKKRDSLQSRLYFYSILHVFTISLPKLAKVNLYVNVAGRWTPSSSHTI